MAKTRVLLADDHAVAGLGFEALLKDAFELVGVVHDGHSLINATESLRPDVVVTALSMPSLNGLDVVRQIRERRPDARIIILTMHRDTQLTVDAFRAGASGYMLKVSPKEELITAIHEVAQGKAYVTTLLSKDLITLLLKAGGKPRTAETPLTARQREVLQLIAQGKTMKEVASILDISPRTGESHKYQIMRVLGVQTTAELVRCAVQLKLVGG